MNELSRLGDPRSIEDLFLYRISRILGTGGSLVTRICEAQFGITRREWRIIAMLGNGPLLSSELAARAQLDRALTSRAITSLVAKKLLLRVPKPGDRRRAVLSLSDEGRATYLGMFDQVVQINQNLLSVMTPEAVDTLDRQLTQLQRQADQAVVSSTLPRTDRWRGGRAPRNLA